MREFFCIKCGSKHHTGLVNPSEHREPGVLAFACPEACGAIVMFDVDAGRIRRVSALAEWSDLPFAFDDVEVDDDVAGSEAG